MYEGALVIDAVVHGFDFSDGNRAARCSAEEFAGFQTFMHQVHTVGESTERGYQRAQGEFIPRVSAEALASATFLESDVDIAFYHHVPIAGFFQHGVSRWDTGLDFRKLAENRVFLYGGVNTFQEDRGKIFAEMEEQAEAGAVGFKFYPSSGIVDPATRRLQTMLYDDPEAAYPFFDKAQELGVKHLAFHKAYPVGPSIAAVRPGDLLTAAVSFPELTFEIVHAGWAFVEDTALELMLHPNVYANMELSGGLSVRQPGRFAHMIGELMRTGGHQKILFASGSAATHVDPILRAFWDFEMPQDLQEQFGYPAVTREMKADMLGLNMARLHGLDPDALIENTAADDWASKRAEGKVEPWALRRAEATA